MCSNCCSRGPNESGDVLCGRYQGLFYSMITVILFDLTFLISNEIEIICLCMTVGYLFMFFLVLQIYGLQFDTVRILLKIIYLFDNWYQVSIYFSWVVSWIG